MSDASGFDEALAKIAAAETMCLELGAAVAIEVDIDAWASQKAEYLQAQGRDFFAITPAAVTRMARAFDEFISTHFDDYGSAPTVFEIFYIGSEEWRSILVNRWTEQGDDVQLVQLSARWLARKRREGKSPLIGIYTGHLIGAVKTARISFLR